MATSIKIKETRKKNKTARKEEIIFLACALAYPLLHFFLLYICVNINSISLSFKTYDIDANKFSFAGFDNFSTLINKLFHDQDYKKMLENSLVMYLFYSPLMLIVSVFVAYAVWKKVYFSKFFSTILFLPSVISSVVFVIIGDKMIKYVLPVFFGENAGLILNAPTGFLTVTIFGWLLQFGPSMIYFSGAMSGISPEVVESGKLEGVNAFQEFIHIVFPSIFPTITSLIVVGFAQIFVNQGLLLSFYGVSLDMSMRTFGYEIYQRIYLDKSYAQYPEVAAMGLLFTFITLPIVFTVKYLLNRFGPKED